MVKQYTHTFVIGKFMNFHQGHEALIKKAIDLGVKTTVLMSYEKADQVDIDTRCKWLQDTFGNWITLRTVDTDYTGLSNKSESDKDVSAEWALYIDDNFTNVDCIVSSEPYGAYVADNIPNCDSYLFDQERTKFPCSSTSIREGDVQHYAQQVKHDLTKTVALIGPESTGKTMSLNLFTKFGFDTLEEVARDIMIDHHYTLSDLDRFALKQYEHIQLARNYSRNLLVASDSSALTTLVYSKLKFNTVSPLVKFLFENEPVDEYLLFKPDCPMVQDGTRTQSDIERWEWYNMAYEILIKQDVPFRIVEGTNWYTRNAKIVKELANAKLI